MMAQTSIRTPNGITKPRKRPRDTSSSGAAVGARVAVVVGVGVPVVVGAAVVVAVTVVVVVVVVPFTVRFPVMTTCPPEGGADLLRLLPVEHVALTRASKFTRSRWPYPREARMVALAVNVVPSTPWV